MQRLAAGFGMELPVRSERRRPWGVINLPAMIIVMLIMIL
jgi:hypothetical protein